MAGWHASSTHSPMRCWMLREPGVDRLGVSAQLLATRGRGRPDRDQVQEGANSRRSVAMMAAIAAV